MKQLVRPMLGLLTFAITYALGWALWYRLPAHSFGEVDCRTSNSHGARKIEFRASLASNPHGFPGHAYVVWDDGETAGYTPRYGKDQIPSLISPVPGFMQRDGDRWNTRNLNRLVVCVDESTFARTKQIAHFWNTEEFQVGKRDCVSFVHTIATTVGLRTPSPSFKFPQDYLVELQALNAKPKDTGHTCEATFIQELTEEMVDAARVSPGNILPSTEAS